jgi:hypothetical protein
VSLRANETYGQHGLTPVIEARHWSGFPDRAGVVNPEGIHASSRDNRTNTANARQRNRGCRYAHLDLSGHGTESDSWSYPHFGSESVRM